MYNVHISPSRSAEFVKLQLFYFCITRALYEYILWKSTSVSRHSRTIINGPISTDKKFKQT